MTKELERAIQKMIEAHKSKGTVEWDEFKILIDRYAIAVAQSVMLEKITLCRSCEQGIGSLQCLIRNKLIDEVNDNIERLSLSR